MRGQFHGTGGQAGGQWRMKILLSWSSGKDSAWALHVLDQAHPGAVQGLLTTVNGDADRVAMHGVRRELLEAQARAVGRPLHVVNLPDPCSNDAYVRLMRDAAATAVSAGFTQVAFGDLFLEDVRRYREECLAGTGLTPLFPLWGEPTSALAQLMIEAGVRSRLSVVDTRVLDASFAGREFDRALLDALPAGADPCGENGEFHTFVHDGPMFREAVVVRSGRLVTRDPFVFCDLCPTPIASSA
jgi:uncharacterized protein (TIGR00290 family)